MVEDSTIDPGRIRRSPFLRIIVLASIIALVVGAIATLPIVQRWRYGAPRIVVDPPQITVRYDESTGPKAAVPLVIRNVGGSVATITSVQSSCGCTVIDGLAGRTLAPQEALQITANATLPGLGQMKVAVVRITTDAVESPNLEVSLQLFGPPFEAPSLAANFPKACYLTRSHSNEGYTGVLEFVTIENQSSDPWIAGMKASIPGVVFQRDSVEITGENSGGTVVRKYTWVLSTDYVPGQEDKGMLRLVYNSESDAETATIPIVLVDTVSLRAIPSKIELILNQNMADRHLNFLVRSNGEASSAVDSVTTDVKWLEPVSELSGIPQAQHVISMMLLADQLKGEQDKTSKCLVTVGMLVDGNKETIRIPVTISMTQSRGTKGPSGPRE